MRLTFLGHAGLLRADRRTARCCAIPWFTPAYFGSWFPFPRNDGLDPAVFGAPDYLYVSHLHRDHFDPDWLARHVNKRGPGAAPGVRRRPARAGAAVGRVHRVRADATTASGSTSTASA